MNVRFYCTDNKGLRIAIELLESEYTKSIEIFDKDPDKSSGVTEEILCYCGKLDPVDLLWIGTKLGRLSKYICWAKIES